MIRSSSAASSTIGRPAKPPTTSAVRSSAVGPSPPLVTIRSHARAEELERGEHVLRPVADHDDVRQLDAALAQPLGEPRAVAVGDHPRQHLGAGDDDAGADAHPAQVGRSDSGSSRGRLPGRMS